MEIISKTVEIESELPVNNEIIEAKLEELGIKPLRWAIVDCKNIKINKYVLTISLACENLW